MMSVEECLTDEANIYLINRNYIKINNSGYLYSEYKNKKIYIKDFNHAEFIGEELCHIKNIQCAHYFLTGINYYSKKYELKRYGDFKNKLLKIDIASIDFKKNNFEYFNIPYNFYHKGNSLRKILSLCPNSKNRNDLLDEIISLFALDIYMGQQDRFGPNIMFYKDRENNIHLAPIYDFEFSLKTNFLLHNDIYKNALFTFRDFSSLKKFISKHSRLGDELESYLDISLVEVVRESYEKRNLIIPSDKEEYYSYFDDDRKKLIKKIIR